MMLGVIFRRAEAPRIILDENVLPEPFKTRLVERRRVRPMQLWGWGIVIGLSLGQVIEAAAREEAQRWLSLDNAISVGTLVFAIGMTYMQIKDSRDRIKKLEETTVTREVHGLLEDRLDDLKNDVRAGFDSINERLDRMTK